MERTKKDQRAVWMRLEKITQVCERAEKEGLAYAGRMSMHMDLDFADRDCPLDFDKLLAFPLPDFQHDILGIARHLDRTKYPGKLGDCFLPRCAIRQDTSEDGDEG